MKRHITFTLATLLLSSNQIYSWEWPVFLKLGYFGSWFMNKEEKYYHSLILKAKTEEVNEKTLIKKEDVEVSKLMSTTYKRLLKQLTTPAADIAKEQRNIGLTNVALKGYLNNLAKYLVTDEGKNKEIKDITGDYIKTVIHRRIVNPEPNDSIKPLISPYSITYLWYLPSVEEHDPIYTYSYPTLVDQASTIYKRRYDEIKTTKTSPNDNEIRLQLKEQLHHDFITTMEAGFRAVKNKQDHDKALEKNKTFYDALLKKHDIKLD